MYQVLFDEKGQPIGCNIFYDCSDCPLCHTYCDKDKQDLLRIFIKENE